MAEDVTYTGTRWTRNSHIARIHQVVDTQGPGRFIVGGAPGVDEIVALRAIDNGRGQDVYAVIPCTTDPADLPWLSKIGGWEQMPAGTTFKQRDARMVELGQRTKGFPLYVESDPRMKRSGTWMTIRIARRERKPVEIYLLEA